MSQRPLPADPAALQTHNPTSLHELFWSFTWLALQGFGGVLTVAQRVIVEQKRWLTQQQFVEEWAVAQIMPGPNVVNLSMILGNRYFGLKGAFVALAGMMAIPTFVVIGLALAYNQWGQWPALQGALRGMATVAAGLFAATGLKMLSSLKHHPLSLGIALLIVLLTFLAVAWLRWPVVWVIPSMGSIALFSTYIRLKQVNAQQMIRPS